MRNYATQMEAARKGIITEELKSVAAKEQMTTDELLPLVASGKVVICANKNHKCNTYSGYKDVYCLGLSLIHISEPTRH